VVRQLEKYMDYRLRGRHKVVANKAARWERQRLQQKQ
jgi:hypothetical protein